MKTENKNLKAFEEMYRSFLGGNKENYQELVVKIGGPVDL
jgi:hypothetical protein